MVIKSTQMYQGAAKGYGEVNRSSLLQMMGRAGRPQFDDRGVVVILVSDPQAAQPSPVDEPGDFIPDWPWACYVPDCGPHEGVLRNH